MQYIVQWDYASNLGGPWKAGQKVELSEAEAEAINRDSPGVLDAKPPAEAKREVAEPPKDRQVKAAKGRAAKKE